MKSLNISVVVCTYNGAAFIEQQIESILNQTLQAYEIIIQDDNSEDHTVDIISKYAVDHKNIFIYRNKKRLGLNQNFLSAFSKATGDYIAISDQDDVWEKERLAIYAEELKRKQYTMVYSDSFITDRDLNVKSVTNNSKPTIYEVIWFGMGGAPGHSMVFKKDILTHLKNIEEIDFIYDWIINLAALAVGEIKKIDIPLTYWRRHDLTITDLTYVPPEVKYKRPFELVLDVFKSLLAKKSVKNFKWQFENIYLILKNFENNPSIKLLSKFLFFYKKETLSGIICATIIYFVLRKDLGIIERIKASYLPIYKYYFYKRDGAGLRGA